METTDNKDTSEAEGLAGVRLVVLNLPEDEGEGLGFRLTRTTWDPYPWVRDVSAGSRAERCGLRAGDCVLQADGRDLLGMPIGEVAALIRGDGAARGVTLCVWSCGVDPHDDPELLWSCGGGARGERARRALAGVVRALACCVCAATATHALACARSHLYCSACWSRLQRCALCRESLPPKDSPYAKNLVAEQVFEAIAAEYELKSALRPTKTTSAYNSPNRSPAMSPTTSRRGQYQISAIKNRRPDFASDPNINRTRETATNSTQTGDSSAGNTSCQCQKATESANANSPHVCQSLLQHKLVARLRQACSLADLQNATVQSCALSKSLNNINLNENCPIHSHGSSIDDLKAGNTGSCDSINNNDTPIFVLSPPPIYVLSCEHGKI
ncbi:uncharacterized protein LOC121736716 [Aricia agestis]|uniref:uncharacterized protein LOC121736716 n=1 Tax=Aricia agestis TaxID=91739 RepID=UPI001C206F02|nr:uncharacterized protein LOC121736716 [Aricia agestis]